MGYLCYAEGWHNIFSIIKESHGDGQEKKKNIFEEKKQDPGYWFDPSH